MKKIFKIIIINLILLILLLFILECSCFSIQVYKNYKQESYRNRTKKEQFIESFNVTKNRYYEKYDNYFNMEEFRPILPNIKNSDFSIILLGCSFTYGNNLQLEETFGSKLSEYTHKNVYNLALPGASPKEMLYILKNENIVNQLAPNNSNIKYVIYTYIKEDTENRLFFNARPYVPNFIEKEDGILVHKKSIFEKNFSAIYEILVTYIVDYIPFSKKEEKFITYMLNIQNEINKQFNNTPPPIRNFCISRR